MSSLRNSALSFRCRLAEVEYDAVSTCASSEFEVPKRILLKLPSKRYTQLTLKVSSENEIE